MKTRIAAVILLMVALVSFAAKKSGDPTLMTIAGHDVPLSEFEYLYHKNNAQQLNPQSLDDYVGMFVDYKLKVAAAEDAGIDTTDAFVNEYIQFRNELAEPYLTDTAITDSLVNAAYSHFLQDRLVSHVMIPAGDTPEASARNRAMLDSLRTAIIDGRTTFAEVAGRYSIDGPSRARGGLMGYVTPGRYPYVFEDAAYNTAKGDISQVINSGFGLHIIRVEDITPASGQVSVSHILRLTRGLSEADAAVQRRAVDSLYTVVSAPGADFADVASRESQDPGSASRGGKLDWFGHGTMVAEFDSVAYALPDGAISKPFATAYGYHIIKKHESRKVRPLDEVRDNILKAIENDGRAELPRRAALDRYLRQYGASIDTANIDATANIISTAGTDSTTFDAIRRDNLTAFVIDGKAIPVIDVIAATPMPLTDNSTLDRTQLLNAAGRMIDGMALELAREDLAATNADYRHLINEYRDGILLFEISNRNIWERAAKDREGLESYFAENRDKYAWNEPKFKGYVIFTSSDTIMPKVKQYADSLTDITDPEKFTETMRARFGREVKVERVVAAKGENAITDYLAFGAPKPANDSARWPAYFAFRGKVIDAPESADDVRGAAVTDYQNMLERRWLDDLHKRYKVKINKKVLRHVK